MKRSILQVLAALTVSALLIVGTVDCKSKIDTQPPKSEIVNVVEQSPDTIILVTVDTVNGVEQKDSTLAIIPAQEQLLSDVSETHSVLEVVYMPPTDSVVDAIYMSQLGVREATGHNDGKDVEKYLKSVGLPKGNAWCAAFVKWTLDRAGVKTSITGWSPTAHNKNNIVLFNGSLKKDVQRGDVFTLYFPSLKRIGHTGFVRKKFGMNSYETVEGNTNMAGSREGDGVYVKYRPKSSIYSITRWF